MYGDNKVVQWAAVLAVLVVAILLLVGKCKPPVEKGTTERDSTAVVAEEQQAAQVLHPQPFDPNHASRQQLQEIGLSKYVINSIMRYRQRGGIYQSVEDFARVPGLTKGTYRALQGYIIIADDDRPAAESLPPRSVPPAAERNDTPSYPRKMARGETIGINSADTSALKRVPGIGTYYASRIVDMRERLGGFVAVDQLLLIAHFPEEAMDYLTVDSIAIRKINLNTADYDTLRRHPYIGAKRARDIVDYRRLKGTITSLHALALAAGLTASEEEALAPYVAF